jgi:phospholipid/cholesterol/gamma-HCH transport system substrate-binding protein
MKQNTKVGVFLLIGFAVLTGIVFMIGDNRQAWAPKIKFVAPFKDVAGLKPGAPVELGGVDIGLVTGVSYGAESGDSRIYVKLNVVRKEAVRIRVGTTAAVAMKGLLGDKMIVLKVPDPTAAEMPDGGTLKTEEAIDFMATFQVLADKAKATLDNIEALTRPLGDPKFAQDIAGTVSSLNEVIGGIAHNDSAVHRLLMDPKEAVQVDQALTNVNNATLKLAQTLGAMEDVAEHVRGGPGIAHGLIYDGDMSKNAAASLDEIRQDLEAIRKGNGLAHAVVFGDDSTQHMLGNLDATTKDLRAIVADIRAGKGTIGGLLVDPTVYEDLKSAVGNVERNQVLRALVRYSIKEDESRVRGDPQVKAQ